MGKHWLQVALVAFAKGLALLALLYGYVHLLARVRYSDPNRPLSGYLEWRVGLLLVGYYVAYALITQGQTTWKRLAYLFACYVGTLALLAPVYAFVLLINTFPHMVFLHQCLLVVLVEYTFTALLPRTQSIH